jgi:RNA polymerase sigma factor (sigma-70 family)
MYNQTISDQELVKSYLDGNERGLTELIKRHKSKIYTSIYFLVKDRDLANDLFQDSFIKIIDKLKSGHYKDEGKFLPWAMRVTHNLVIDHFRIEKRMPKLRETEEYSIFDRLYFEEDSIEDKILKNQLYEELRILISELPYEQREIIIMRHYANMSFKEIADITQVSINTSLGRMRYAIMNLRRLITKNNIEINI